MKIDKLYSIVGNKIIVCIKFRDSYTSLLSDILKLKESVYFLEGFSDNDIKVKVFTDRKFGILFFVPLSYDYDLEILNFKLVKNIPTVFS